MRPEDDCHEKRCELKTMLRNSYRIKYATLQMDHVRDGSTPFEPVSGHFLPAAMQL